MRSKCLAQMRELKANRSRIGEETTEFQPMQEVSLIVEFTADSLLCIQFL